MLMSQAKFAELVSRLDRPKFDRYREREAWNLFLTAVVELALWLEDAVVATGIAREVDEDESLALAAIGQGDAIINGDSVLLELGAHDGIPILTPAQFLQRLLESQP